GSGARHMAGVRKGEKGDVTGTNLLWQTTKRTSPYVPTSLGWGGHLYVVGDKGTVGCLDAKTGTEVWAEKLDAGDISASPVLIDGKVYVISDDGDAYVYAAAPSFKLLAK